MTATAAAISSQVAIGFACIGVPVLIVLAIAVAVGQSASPPREEASGDVRPGATVWSGGTVGNSGEDLFEQTGFEVPPRRHEPTADERARGAHVHELDLPKEL